MDKKIAFVCQRYGIEVNGGSELYCRQYAERLTKYYDVEVFTTCAIDHITWENYYPAGISKINNVIVRRYPVKRKRNIKKFGLLSRLIFNNPNRKEADELKWLKEQGPFCDKLIKDIIDKQNDYVAIVFMTYLYYPTAMGITSGCRNAILIPTVHDEPPVYLNYYDKVFLSARGIVWNTVEEKNFAEKRFPKIHKTPGILTGIGIDMTYDAVLPQIDDVLINKKYIVYVGRIEEGKGCDALFDYFRRYKKAYKDDLYLVLLGKASMPIPKDKDIIYLGFVSEEMKFAVMKSAFALVLCSQFESLSMVVLENMAMGRPVLVNGMCDVLKGHCIRSSAGLYFENYDEFAGTLKYLMNNQEVYDQMCINGKIYVDKYYRWEKIIPNMCDFIEGLSN